MTFEPGLTGLVETARSFSTTLWATRKGRSRAAFEAWQSKQLQKWLQSDVPKVAKYANAPRTLSELPIIDKTHLMGDFEAFNVPGYSADRVRTALAGDCRIDDFTVGASTGTSGNRGLFVVSHRERFRWLGAILAKAMPDLVLTRQRVAILLPQGGALYDSANSASRIDLQFFPLVEGPEAWRDRLEALAPTVIVAPPKVLRYLVENAYRIDPKRIFSAAESLDPMDRIAIEAGFNQPLEQIYMATEGLLGVTCRLGTLHLAEESIYFEFEPAGDGLHNPVISSFRRQTQIMARYRMNDLLRLADAPCPCGSPLRAVAEVVGRVDDVFKFQAGNHHVMVTPDVLRNAVLGAGQEIDDFRLVQDVKGRVVLRLTDAVPADVATRARQAVETTLAKRAVDAPVDLVRGAMPLDVRRKLRRVERKTE